MNKYKNVSLSGNSGTTLDLFQNRFNYNQKVMNSESYSYTADLIETHVLYGKINNNKPVFPSEVGLKTISNENLNNIVVFDFIADAFNDLKEYQKQYVYTNKFSNKDNTFFLLNPTKGFQNLTADYVEYVQRYFFAFSNNLTRSADKEKIKTFEDFVNSFISFIEPLISSVPLNRSEYIKSRYSDPFTTGLFIQLVSPSKVSDDRVIVDEIVGNINFPIFVDNAKRYGFFIDKYNPWRIIADLQSPPMIQYMNNYGIKNYSDLFEKRYFIAENTDIINLKELMVSYYNAYIQNNPVVQTKNYFNGCGTGYETFGNKPVTRQFIEQKYGNEFFVRLYFYIKCKENNAKYDQSDFERIFREALKIYKYVDEESCINYINSKFPILSNKSDRTSRLTSEPDFDTIVKQSDNPNVFTPYKF